MLRLRKCVLAHISSPASAPLVSIHRLLSAAAPSVSTNPSFDLVASYGLIRPQTLKSPSKPDAVLACLGDLGLSSADVAKDPKFLCSRVEGTLPLPPNAVNLTSLGLPRSEIFRGRSVISKLQYYLPLFGSCENLLRALKRNPHMPSSDLESVVKSALTFFAKICICQPRLLNTNLEKDELQHTSEFLTSDMELEKAYVAQRSGMFSYNLEGWLRPRWFLKANALLEQRRGYHTAVHVSQKVFKQHKGRMKGKSCGGDHISFGRYALQALEPAWITAKQIEAGRRAITRRAHHDGKIWVRIFPDKPVTLRPAETRMGRGKGSVAYWAAVVKPGKILYEMDGVSEAVARAAISIAAGKMPIRTQFLRIETQKDY